MRITHSFTNSWYRLELRGRNVRHELQDTIPHRCLGRTCMLFRTPSLLLTATHLLAQMLFEIIVLVSTILNALDRPSQSELPLTRALYRDGITYFLVCVFLEINISASQ